MTDLRQAAQQALILLDSGNPYHQQLAANVLRKALAQPEQEPVAWLTVNKNGGTQSLIRASLLEKIGRNDDHDYFPLSITTQRTWVCLTDEDKKTIATAAGCTEDDDGHIVTEIFRLAEIKLKERNGY